MAKMHMGTDICRTCKYEKKCGTLNTAGCVGYRPKNNNKLSKQYD